MNWLALTEPGSFFGVAIQLLPGLGLFAFGLLLGYRLARRRRLQAERGVTSAAEAEARAARESAAAAEREIGLLLGQLAAGGREQGRLESLVLGLESRLRSWQGRVEAAGHRAPAEKRAGPAAAPADSGCREALEAARLPVSRLGEALRGEQGRVAAGLARLERLEDRLGEGGGEIRRLASVLSATRGEAVRRAGEPGAGEEVAALAGKLSHLVDQIRVVSQNLEGCAARGRVAREYLQAEQSRLLDATYPLNQAESLLARDAADRAAAGEILSRAEAKLEDVRAHAGKLKNGVDQEIGELLGRIDWAARDAPAGLLKAIAALEEAGGRGGGAADLAGGREFWSGIGQLQGELESLRQAVQAGIARKPGTGCAKRRLAVALEQAGAGMLQARSLLDAARERAAVAAAERALSGDPEHVADPVAELEAMKAENTRLEAEIGELVGLLEARDAEIDGLRRQRDNAARDEPLTANPIAARTAASLVLPAREAGGASAVGDSGSGSRQFIRRLLGMRGNRPRVLAPGGRQGASAAAVVQTARLPAGSLAEARAEIRELSRVPLPSPEIAQPAGGMAGNGKLSRPVAPERATEADADVFRAKELRQRVRIREEQAAALEAEAAPFRPPDSTPAAAPGQRIFPGETLPEGEREILLFRGRDPGIWNTREGGDPGAGGPYARPLADLPPDIGYLRVKRLDTGESVVAAVARDELLAGGTPKARRGWSGRGEHYFSASHLGFFDHALPREVETKFGAGGWGFGHRESIGSGQAYAWAGRAVADPGEGFAISAGPLPSGIDFPPSEEATDAGQESGPRREEVSAETVAAALAAPRARESRPAEPGDSFGLEHPCDDRAAGLVLFRSADPAIWGQETDEGPDRLALSLDGLPRGLRYLRLRRMDTGEGVVLPVADGDLKGDGEGRARGFNGTNEYFYGAHHLGVFDETLPQEVETRFTFGGWGFGHGSAGAEVQAWGWEGSRIDPGAVFEIAVFRRLPVLGEADRLLEG